MPIYEYTCQKCKAHIEILQKLTDKPLTRCKKCGGKLEKQWSTPGIQFKGTGWYVTDYAGRKSDAKESESKGAVKAETKGDVKAEAKADKQADSTTAKQPSATTTSNTSGD